MSKKFDGEWLNLSESRSLRNLGLGLYYKFSHYLCSLSISFDISVLQNTKKAVFPKVKWQRGITSPNSVQKENVFSTCPSFSLVTIKKHNISLINPEITLKLQVAKSRVRSALDAGEICMRRFSGSGTLVSSAILSDRVTHPFFSLDPASGQWSWTCSPSRSSRCSCSCVCVCVSVSVLSSLAAVTVAHHGSVNTSSPLSADVIYQFDQSDCLYLSTRVQLYNN